MAGDTVRGTGTSPARKVPKKDRQSRTGLPCASESKKKEVKLTDGWLWESVRLCRSKQTGCIMSGRD